MFTKLTDNSDSGVYRRDLKGKGADMQAIIMAAGRGSRLGHMTDEIPKAFLKIRGIRLIEYNVALLRYFNIKKIILVTGYKSEYFEEFFGKAADIEIVYNPFYELMNVAGSFFMGQGYLSNGEDAIYMHADTLCAPEIMERILAAEGDLILPVDFGGCDDEAMKVRTENGRVIEISKKIPLHQAEGEFIGIARMGRKIIPYVRSSVKKILKEKHFDYYFEGAVQDLINQKKYKIVTVPTDSYFWGEIDFMEDYEKVCEMLPENLYRIASGELFL